MELRNIKTFIRVAELGNFSRAAADLGYAQSTVTGQIQMLERELDVTLFERNGKHAVLSDAGTEFLSYAYQLQQCEAMVLEHFSSEQEPHGNVSVGVMETLCSSDYGTIFRKFRMRYPKVNLRVVVAKTLDCMEMLRKGDLDVILTVDEKIHRKNWETAHEIPAEICFFCSAEHPFAGKQNIPLDTLLAENFIQIEAGCNYRQAFEQYVEQQDKVVTNVMEIGFSSLIIDAVEQNLGVSILPRFTLERALAGGRIALFTLEDFQLTMLMQVIYSKNRWVNPAMAAFLEMTKEVLVS